MRKLCFGCVTIGSGGGRFGFGRAQTTTLPNLRHSLRHNSVGRLVGAACRAVQVGVANASGTPLGGSETGNGIVIARRSRRADDGIGGAGAYPPDAAPGGAAAARVRPRIAAVMRAAHAVGGD